MKPFALMMLFATLLMTACNTVKGMGQDIERAGQGIKKAVK